MQQRRPMGISILSLSLGTLGALTLIAYPIGLVRAVEISEIPALLFTLGLVYGVTAIAAAWGLWRLSPRAPSIFLLWCASACAYWTILALDIGPLIFPGFATGLVLFFFGYRYTRRVCDPAP
jgi:hypothetical protein